MGVPLTWSTACPDWEARIVKGEPLIAFPPIFPDEAADALETFKALRIVDAPGSPLIADACRQWVFDFAGQIFGSYNSETGRRLIREYFLLISKKNSKSTIAAGIMLTALILNWRESAEFIILSPTIEVANNSFKPAADMVRKDPFLSEMLSVQDHIRTITHRETGATLKVVAADSNTVSGKKAVGVLIDEMWLFGKMPNAEDMLREATGGLMSRPEGFIIYLTTQSNEPPAGVFKAKLEYARKVRDGQIVDPQFLPLLYEFPMAMIDAGEHLKPENFHITNPNISNAQSIGSVDRETLEREFRIAQENGEESVRGFLAKHLNVEIGLNLRADRWPGAEFWPGAKHSEPVTLDYLLQWAEVVTGGIDGGGLDDLLGLCFIGRHKITRKWMHYAYAWAHPSVLERRKDISSRLKDFARAKEMTLVTQIGQDVDELADMVARVYESGLLFQVGLDPAAIGGVLDAILLREVPEDKMVTVSQGWRLAGAIKTFERKLAEGVIVHSGTLLMAWCVGNAKVKLVGNALVITKQVSGSAKIDPLMASFNAAHLMSLNPPAQTNEMNFDLMAVCG